MVQKLLRFEGLVVFLASLFFYQLFGGSWILFVLLFLTPDIALVGYLFNKKIGATVYNLVHNDILALLLIIAGILLNQALFIWLGLILAAHVGIDRLFGFGLKYQKDSKETHMQKV